MAKRILLAFILSALFTGCGSFDPVNPPSASASGPQSFPAIPANGGTITLEPGDYACPGKIPSGTHIIGHGAIVPPDLINDKTFAPIASPAAPVVRIVCPATFSLTDVSGVEMSGVVFDFQNAGGLVVDSVTYSRFDLGIVNSTVGLTVQSKDGNNMGNVFPRVVIYNTQTGILLQGLNSTAVTWNDFGHVDIVRAVNYGVVVSQFADTNTFAAIRIRMNNSAIAGLVFNDKAVLGDVDASGNTVTAIGCDADGPAFAGYCVDFRGYTVGNKVSMGFGIMPDSNKIHYDNSFSQSANAVTKIQEVPKLP
jgi:hypothetical protein